MLYGKQEAVMTRGLAILSMVCLHLFCKLGDDIVYTPLIWLNDEIPLIYTVGFFSTICVPIYSICAGYAQYLLFENKKSTFKNNCSRILKLLENYWIILVLFCILGLFFDKEGKIPGNIFYFLESIFLVHNYNGIWWYLKTYIILLLIPASIVFYPVRKMKNSFFIGGVIVCLMLNVGWFFLGHFGFDSIDVGVEIVDRMYTELYNLLHVVPYYWMGAILYKGKVFDRIDIFFNRINKRALINAVLIIVGIVVFVGANIVGNSIISGGVGLIVFILFNVIEKPKFIKDFFLFLGEHSTNIWLVHAFFYLIIFKGLVYKAKYPILILLFMLLLCILTSYIVMFIQKIVDRCLKIVSSKREV